VDVDLASAPAKLGDFGALLLAWIKERLKDLLEAELKLANEFADWVKANFEHFKDAIEQVVDVLKREFDVARDVADGLLQGIGYAAAEIEKAVDEAYQFVRKACSATQAVLAL
jgi:argininosuccinate lyase